MEVSILIGKIIEEFYQLLKQTKFCGIFVILDKVPIQYKTLVKEKYNIDIYDISNILYIIYGDKDLQKELNNIINFSLDGITPQAKNYKNPIKQGEICTTEKYLFEAL